MGYFHYFRLYGKVFFQHLRAEIHTWCLSHVGDVIIHGGNTHLFVDSLNGPSFYHSTILPSFYRSTIFRWVWTRDPLLVWNMHLKNKRNGLLGRSFVFICIYLFLVTTTFIGGQLENHQCTYLFKEIIINRHLIGCHPTSARKRKVRKVEGSSTLFVQTS